MNEQTFCDAIEAAEKFLKAAKTLSNDGELRGETGTRGIKGYYPPSKHTAALRRASVELTKSLVELRRNGYGSI